MGLLQRRRALLTPDERNRTADLSRQKTGPGQPCQCPPQGKSCLTAKSGLNHNEKMSDAEREPIIRRVADRLAPRFPATPRHRIEGIVAEEYDSLETGRIRIYIPTLIENSARTRLHRELKD